MQDDDLVVGLDAIGEILGRSRPTVLLMIHNDHLPAVKIRSRWISSKAMLNNYIRQKLKGEKSTEFQCPTCP